jgi:cyclic pyranopterin phosphate synthase
MEFLPKRDLLTLEELDRLCSAFVAQGVEKLRITGGEPLVRKDALWLIERLGALPGLDNLVMTTNGSQLDRFATALKSAGVKRINISLDTLKADRFKAITRIGDLSKVLGGIKAAQAAGFRRTKLNTVMMRGINDDEFADLVQFALDNQLDLSFIEEMPLGEIHGRSGTYISSEETREQLGRRFELIPSAESSGGPARYWRIPGSESRIGFISPHSHNFCDTCNRVRITAKGELYPCLGQNDALHLMPILREFPGQDAPLRQAIMDSMGIKPFGHDFTRQMDAPQVVRFMSMTGG